MLRSSERSSVLFRKRPQHIPVFPYTLAICCVYLPNMRRSHSPHDASEHSEAARLAKENKALERQLKASFAALDGYLEVQTSLEHKRKLSPSLICHCVESCMKDSTAAG